MLLAEASTGCNILFHRVKSPNNIFSYPNLVLENLSELSLKKKREYESSFSPLKKGAFTLAEVLITLGIIGVVAAMTIPTLIANTNSAKFTSQFAKSLSTLNQAGLMSKAQYDFDYSGADNVCSTTTGGAENPEDVMTFCALLNGTLSGGSFIGSPKKLYRPDSSTKDGKVAYSINKPTANYTFSMGDNPSLDNYIAYQMADGAIVAFDKEAKNCTLTLGARMVATTITGDGALAHCLGFIDVNGTTLPNKEVTCGTSASSGTSDLSPDRPCVVKRDAKHVTDIYPVVFHDATVEPVSNAAVALLRDAKK